MVAPLTRSARLSGAMPSPVRVRAALLGSAAAASATAITAVAVSWAASSWARQDLADLPSVGAGVERLTATALALSSGWLAMVLAAATIGVWRATGHPSAPARRGTAIIARLSWLLVGAAVASLPAAAMAQSSAVGISTPDRLGDATGVRQALPSWFLTTDSTPPGGSDQHRDDPPEPGWVPTSTPRQPIADIELVSRGRAPRDSVVVHRGDTLWGIAARDLGPRAAPEAIAARWPAWYAANRAVIGPDPDLILPGQQLRPPPVQQPSSEEVSCP